MGCSTVLVGLFGSCISGILGIVFFGFLSGFGIFILSLPMFFLIGFGLGLVLVAIFDR